MPLHRSPISSSQPNLNSPREDFITRFNLRKRKCPENDKFSKFCDEVKEMMNEFRIDQDSRWARVDRAMEELTSQNKKIIESNSEIKKMLQDTKKQNHELRVKIKIIENEYTDAKLKIDELEEQVHELQKNQFKRTIEIKNVPRLQNEDLHTMLDNIIKVVGVIENKPDIEQIYRRGKENAPIIVELKDAADKIRILKAVTFYNKENKDNKLNSTHLGISSPITLIYIYEKNTHFIKKLFASAKGLANEGNYRYCWISKGMVMLRKEEG
ncbi:unnamed protein product [Chilo suppressalis]|uniref:FP protein C-terminal domain-containing protein n=1 Tax=Chilo suppressalis TaxID=168631 RepID=A0ABN8B133_CHISP|nr:unnamed protein product [Chilo suppressalis]